MIRLGGDASNAGRASIEATDAELFAIEAEAEVLSAELAVVDAELALLREPGPAASAAYLRALLDLVDLLDLTGDSRTVT